MVWRATFLALMVWFCPPVWADDAGGSNGNQSLTCEGRWVNPITDVCWECIFPMSVGSVQVSAGRLPDTDNPASPIQICPVPPPIFERTGVAVGYWEPFAMTDVTRSPGCMVNMGGFNINIPNTGTGVGTKTANEHPGTFYHVHWYKYPLISWLSIITSEMCLQGGEYDIGYLSELDPTWQNDNLALFLNPEVMLFANPVAQMACAADAVASGVSRPIDALFWCAGSHGSMYPFTGNIVSQSHTHELQKMASETETLSAGTRDNYTQQFVQWAMQRSPGNAETILTNTSDEGVQKQRDGMVQEFFEEKLQGRIDGNYAQNAGSTSEGMGAPANTAGAQFGGAYNRASQSIDAGVARNNIRTNVGTEVEAQQTSINERNNQAQTELRAGEAQTTAGGNDRKNEFNHAGQDYQREKAAADKAQANWLPKEANDMLNKNAKAKEFYDKQRNKK